MAVANKHLALLILFWIGLALSAIQPKEYFTWFLEVFPALCAFLVLSITYPFFKFTQLTYTLVVLHCFVLFIGAHYTYAEVPLFNWIRDELGQGRNNFDKLGHFLQGFVPALFIREILVRNQVVAKPNWLPWVVIWACVTVSVSYEFLEWFVAVQIGQAADAFLGTQGYEWDTQSDMLMALIGASLSMTTMTAWQDRQLAELNKN